MRITNKMLANNFLNDMNANLQNLQNLQNQMTSGKEIRKPSDDPFKVSRSMQLHSEINANKQYNSNIKDTINWLDTTDTALNQAGDIMQRIRELLISAGDAAYGSNERSSINDEINERISEFAQVMNTNFDGKYIFGGTRGTVKPMDTDLGYFNENSVETNSLNLSGENSIKTLNLKIKINDKTLNLKLDDLSKVNNINDLANSVNNQIQKYSDINGKIKVIPSYSNNSLIFVNTDLNKDDKIFINSNIIKDGTPKQILYSPNNENNEIFYYKEGGGKLLDESKLNQINQSLNVEISKGVVFTYNVNACQVMQFKNQDGEEKDLREIFKNIVSHLSSESKDDLDYENVKKILNSDLKDVTDTINNILKLRAEVGAKENSMDAAKNKNIDQNFNMTKILSKTEDIDLTEKTMQFAIAQTVYMASLQTSARVLQPTLLDYLR